MKFRSKKVGITALILLVALLAAKCRPDSSTETARIERGSIEVWSAYMGTIESENVRNIVSAFHGSANLMEIIADGSAVTQGMAVARFDSSRWEDELIEVNKNLLLAEADFESLVHAKLPLEIRDLEAKLLAASTELSEQKQALSDTKELFSENLVSEYEVKQLEVKVSSTESEIDRLNHTIDLTKKHLHPSAEQRARTALESARNAYSNTLRRIESSVCRSPCNGIAVHKPTNIGGDFRCVRVGDALWRSQVFMTVSDMSELIARCDVPEGELTRIQPGAEAFVRPVAFPDLEFKGRVLAVGSMAQQLPGQSDGAKYFEVVVKLESADSSLRSDMSAEVRILSFKADKVLLIPRAAVWWENGKPFCNSVRFGKKRKKQIAVGPADESNFQLVDGLEPGEKVAVR